MKLLSHPNVVDLRAYFYSTGDKVYDHSHFHSPLLLLDQHILPCTLTDHSN